MSIKCQTIISTLEQLAPKRLAEDWDNVGLQIGDPSHDINKILVTLDLTEEVVDEAIENKANMIITHHPFIFKPLKNIRWDLPNGKLIKKIIQKEINVYTAHTNLDIAKHGLNDMLAEKLELKNIEILSPTTTEENQGEAYGLGRIGIYDTPMDYETFIEKIKTVLNIDYVRVAGVEKSKIKKVGLCTGSGSEFIHKAAIKGVDVYITGDVKYHEAQQAKDLKISLIDAGHFPTEIIVMEGLKKYLDEEFKKAKRDIEVITSKENKDSLTYR